MEEEGAARPMARCFVSLCIPEESSPSPSPSPSRSSSSTGLRRDTENVEGRVRTTSLPPKAARAPGAPPRRPHAASISGAPNGSPRGAKRPTPVRRSTLGLPTRPTETRKEPSVPFFLSPVHDPSTHPRWAHLEAGDFAPWLTVNERAGTQVEVAVWVEEKHRWRRLPGVGGLVDLNDMVAIPKGEVVPPNTLEWTFANLKEKYYLPLHGLFEKPKRAVEGVVERSMRETRMKKGANVGALHHIQSVIADTQRSITSIQCQIDRLIKADADRSASRREISERSLRVRWVRDRVAEVERTVEEAKAKITLRRGRLDARRALLDAAIERAEQTQSKVVELTAAVTDVESERANILPRIYALRARHAQALDQLFPITPIYAATLLYTICGVPLSIPQGPKEPAPPLFLTAAQTPEGCPKVDERSTSAALGYAALLVQLIANLGGQAAGLAYPVTYAGSRSHVRDVISVMQGPRSFPLYGKGVERYRYEYAVFLLNKDIELLMHETDIRMLDLRHTLPNLKSLLLTLSSPVPPPPGPVTGPGWASGAASRASSRQPSATFPSRVAAFSRSASGGWRGSVSSLPNLLVAAERARRERELSVDSALSVEGSSALASIPSTPIMGVKSAEWSSPRSGLREQSWSEAEPDSAPEITEDEGEGDYDEPQDAASEHSVKTEGTGRTQKVYAAAVPVS